MVPPQNQGESASNQVPTVFVEATGVPATQWQRREGASLPPIQRPDSSFEEPPSALPAESFPPQQHTTQESGYPSLPAANGFAGTYSKIGADSIAAGSSSSRWKLLENAKGSKTLSQLDFYAVRERSSSFGGTSVSIIVLISTLVYIGFAVWQASGMAML